MAISSRYCTQILDKDIDNCCTALLQDLVRFQDRLYHKDPVKVLYQLHSQNDTDLGEQGNSIEHWLDRLRNAQNRSVHAISSTDGWVSL